ncbi:hypothetical protein SAMN05216276_101291 [Streptosporangium subroseum]|uniref:FtsX extracellular domain-containing protein n=1 Tax=Streptosporangium subroseum TaxID=106412 RepID=A0A239FTV8_9ACTN|nr:permease-like cell division protein FtsX [Streptosporangium subroseum]SNS60437.1 hypothetical protein SAMN05216276_101291 [Streptosporangium subroseum]
MEQEELSFGDDGPDREPRLGPWMAAHTRLLAACAAVLVVLGLAAGGGWYLYERSWLPQPPPEVALSPSLRFEVFMCGCDGMAKATVEQGQGAEAALRALPQVTSVEVRSGEEMSNERRRSYEGIGDRSVQSSATVGDVLRGTLRRSEDFPAVAEKMKSVPGVAGAWRGPTTFWAGRADAEIALCGKEPMFSDAPECQRSRRAGVTGAATEEEKAAIAARLRDLPGVETIYFEDPGHALKLMKLSDPEHASGGIFTGSFFVKFSDPALARALVPAVRPLAGVFTVFPVPSEG